MATKQLSTKPSVRIKLGCESYDFTGKIWESSKETILDLTAKLVKDHAAMSAKIVVNNQIQWSWKA